MEWYNRCMKRIVCFGDSNTWGYDGDNSGSRFEDRWTKRLGMLLGEGYEVIEEGLGGRTTVFEDPLNPGRNGLLYLTPCLLSHKYFDTLIIMLGTNDAKERFSATAVNIADGMKRLAVTAKSLDVWKGSVDILIAAPSPIRPECERSPFSGEMGICSEKTYRLGEEYKKTAALVGARFFDAAPAEVNHTDYMHLSQAGHQWLAGKLAELVR